MDKSKLARRGVTVAVSWFMIVSQHPGGTLTAATQGPFATQAQCDWARQQIGVTTGLRGGQGVGWGATECWTGAAEPIPARGRAITAGGASSAGARSLGAV